MSRVQASEGHVGRRASPAGLRREPRLQIAAHRLVCPALILLAEAPVEGWTPSAARRLYPAQQQALVAEIGQERGNRQAQVLIDALRLGPANGLAAGGQERLRPPTALVQRAQDDDEEEEDVEEHSSERLREMRAARAAQAAGPPLTVVEVTPEEALEDLRGPGPMPQTAEIEENMRRELAISEGTETLLYINMPGLIGGMSFKRERMRPMFEALKRARDAITQEAVYQQWLENPADPARRAALDERIARFEEELGLGIRTEIRDGWQGRQAGDPAGAAAIGQACREIGETLRGERERLFAAGGPPAEALEIPDLGAVRDRLGEQHQRITGELVPGANRLALGSLGAGVRTAPLSSLSTLRAAISQAHQAVCERVRGASLARLDSLLGNAVLLAGQAAAAFDGLAEQMADHNQRVAYMVASIMDPDVVPILVPATRQTAAVTFRGERSTYHTRHESRMSYYEHAYMLAEAPPPRSLAEAPARRPSNARLARVGDVFRALSALNVAASEAKILAAIAYSEGGFGSTQTVDMVRLSWGILSFQGGALMNLLRRIRDESPAVFGEYFESFGITIREAGRTPAPVERQSREMAGPEEGFRTHEAYSVEDLLVYDHRARVWVAGNEGLAVIQGDPRYQALFVAAGNVGAVQMAQAAEACGRFIHPVRNQRLTLGDGEAGSSLRIGDFVNNEVAMFGLVDRKVANGNIGFASAMFNAYLEARGLTAQELAAAPNQPDIAAWVRGYDVDIRWDLADHLAPAGVEALSDSAYAGAV